jgi:presenilin-like A22 family membrane protease
MSDMNGDFRRQLPSMIGMASMFLVTIFLAMFIRPWYDKAGLQAFGAEGASQIRYIALELLMIFVFTAAILALARYKKEWVIKYGIMGILFIALMYASVPLAHQIMVDDTVEPFEYESTDFVEAEYLTEIGMNQYIDSVRTNESGIINNTIRLNQLGLEEPIWTSVIPHGNESYELAKLVVATGPDTITINNGALIQTLSLTDGTLLSTYECFEYDADGNIFPIVQFGCILAVETSDSVYIVDGGEKIHRFATFDEAPNVMTLQAIWQLPNEMKVVDDLIEAELLDDNHLLIVSKEMAGVVELEKNTNQIGTSGTGAQQNAKVLINATSSANFSAADVGYSNVADVTMSEADNANQLIVLGTEDGDIMSWNFQPGGEPMVVEESKVSINNFADQIRDVRLTDIDNSGYTELLITTGDEARLLYGSSMVQRLIVDVAEGENVAVAFGDTPKDAADDTTHLYAVVIGENYSTTSGVVESSMFLSGGIVFEDIPTMIGLLVSIILMILLYVHSEWYVVNTVGILVGSGVIVMLGVSFVPTLIMVFMVAAAIYDAWAVYKSKHMLDLADTMINLNLPILLVAPQGSDYSFRAERAPLGDSNPGDSPTSVLMNDSGTSPQANMQPRERVIKKSNDAMLMGLGDVIFPGMLVLSTLQYIGGDDGWIMAITTLVGSLVGYSILMWYVGQGKAQAGLPLLNGGAILGYVLGGLMTIGMAMFQFNISL